MSYLSTEKFLAVGRLIAMELNRLPVKSAADLLDTSDMTIKKMRQGVLPNAVTLLRAIENFGLKILEPVLGPSDNASLARRLDLILAEVGDLKNVVSPAVSQASDNFLGTVGADCRLASRNFAPADGQILSGLALVSGRRSLSDITRGPGALGRSLNLWREKSGQGRLSDLIAFANDNPAERIGLSREENGSLVFAHLNPAFRLYSPDERQILIGKPTTAGPDRDYAEACTAKIVQALDGGDPVLEDISATVRPEEGVALDLTYERLILPWRDGNARVAFVHSRMRAAA